MLSAPRASGGRAPPPREVRAEREQTVEQVVVPATRRTLSETRQQTLATMVLMGINRVVVDDGEISAKLQFHIDASESMAYGTIESGGATWTKYDHATAIGDSLPAPEANYFGIWEFIKHGLVSAPFWLAVAGIAFGFCWFSAHFGRRSGTLSFR